MYTAQITTQLTTEVYVCTSVHMLVFKSMYVYMHLCIYTVCVCVHVHMCKYRMYWYIKTAASQPNNNSSMYTENAQ